MEGEECLEARQIQVSNQVIFASIVECHCWPQIAKLLKSCKKENIISPEALFLSTEWKTLLGSEIYLSTLVVLSLMKPTVFPMV